MKHRVVVVGAGFAGLQLVQDLRGSDCQITLVDQRNHHLFQPLLYQVATTLLATSEIAWPIRRVLRDRKEVTTLLGTVDAVDRARREVLHEHVRRGGQPGQHLAVHHRVPPSVAVIEHPSIARLVAAAGREEATALLTTLFRRCGALGFG